MSEKSRYDTSKIAPTSNFESWRQVIFARLAVCCVVFIIMTTATPLRSNTGTGKVTSYESFAPRSTAQISRLGRLEAVTKGRAALATDPIPETDLLADFFKVSPLDQSQLLLEENATLKQACGVSDAITTQLKHTTSLRLALRASINIAEDLSNRHAQLLRHSSELSASADRLKDEEQILSKHAEDIGRPLRHYDAVDRIGVLVGVIFKGNNTIRASAKVKVDDDEFPELLDQLDMAVEFFGRESGGKRALEEAKKKPSMSGNVEYFRRALALQEAALNLIRLAVAERIATTAQQISGSLKNPVQADQLEASVIYTRFHGISARSGKLLALVKARLHKDQAYQELLQACQTAYCSHREKLLQATVQEHMEKLKQEHGPVGMTRLASVFLIRLCTVETGLYLDFFGTGKNDSTTLKDGTFQAYLTRLCSALHRTIRRGLVTMLDLDTLCQMVSVLREERTQAMESPKTLPAARAISTVIQDAQERLIYSANTTLTKNVVRFKATPADLDYPARLEQKVEATADAEKQLEQVYESWFPPIRTVLRVLSKIFRVVEPVVFEDMARTAVQACTKSLQEGAAYIKKRSGARHGNLFLVKHLLTLREQLSPFDLQWQTVERQLDFSEAGTAVARFWANRNRRVFSMSTNENALVSLLREGVSIQESRVDSKRDLEEALRSSCNDFIGDTTKTLIGDISGLVTLCNSSESREMSIQTHLTPDSLLETLTKTSDDLVTEVDVLQGQMSLYLESSATQNILLKPVSRKVVKVLEDLRKLLSSAIDWDDEKMSEAQALISKIEANAKVVGKPSKA